MVLIITTDEINEGRVNDAVVVDYVFLEGAGSIVTDVSGVDPAMDLTVRDPGNVTWVTDQGEGVNGLRLDSATRLTAQGDSKITAACLGSGEVSLECWVTALNETQDQPSGPARIITMSPDGLGSSQHNFMLGMGEFGNASLNTQCRVRLRTSSTNLDGVQGGAAANTPPGAIDTNLRHVVATFGNGRLKIYVDGAEVSDTQWDGVLNWPDGSGSNPLMNLALGNEFGAERPWLGTFHRVAIHSRELDAGEVLINYAAGVLGGGELPAPTITFETSFDYVQEDVGQVVVNAVLNRPAPAGGVSFTVTRDPSSTMVDPADYTLSSPGTIAEGETQAPITISVANDSVPESIETLVLNLTSTEADPGVITQYSLEVTDDDTPPEVSFVTGDESISTSASTAMVALELSRTYSDTVTVPITVSGTATGAEFSGPLPNPVVFAPGETAKQITLTFGTPVDGNTIELAFGGITNGSGVGITSKVLTFTAGSFATITPGGNVDFTRAVGGPVGGNRPTGTFAQLPWRTYLEPGMPSTQRLSVCAGHRTGIASVSFQIDGGSIVTVSETEIDDAYAMTFWAGQSQEMTSLGIECYGVEMLAADFPDGRHRCLANVTANDGAEIQIELEFWTNANQTDTPVELYVQTGGSGNGTEGNPYGSILQAINSLSTPQAEGARIYLMQGGGVYDIPQTIEPANSRPIEIRYHPSVARDAIAVRPTGARFPRRMVFDGPVWDRVNTNSLQNYAHLEDGRQIWVNGLWTAMGTPLSRAALDAGSTAAINSPMTAGHYGRSKGVYHQNMRIHDVSSGAQSFVYHNVNVEQSYVGGAPWRGHQFVINCHAWDGRPDDGSIFHPDHFHFISRDRGLTYGAGRVEGFLFQQSSTIGCSGQPIFVPHALDNAVIENCMVLHRLPSLHQTDITPAISDGAGSVCRNLTISHFSSPWNQADLDGSAPSNVHVDCEFHASIVRGLISSDGWTITSGHIQSFPTISGAIPNTPQGSEPGGWTWSDNESDVWVSPAVTPLVDNLYPNHDYTPKGTGPLVDRVDLSHPLTPKFDMLGRRRGNVNSKTALGPLRGEDEVG